MCECVCVFVGFVTCVSFGNMCICIYRVLYCLYCVFCIVSFMNIFSSRALVKKPEGMRPLGRPRHRWEDNIKMDRQEVRCGDMDWIGLARDRDRWRALVNVVMHLRVP
jgi:hypothetical protein